MKISKLSVYVEYSKRILVCLFSELLVFFPKYCCKTFFILNLVAKRYSSEYRNSSIHCR